MDKLGVIDVGSNSIRLVILKINQDNSFRIIDEKKETVRLGMDMTPEGGLNPERARKAIETLRFFVDICKGTDVNDILAVATEAVRRASKQDNFTARVKEETGIDISILSGSEEAFYDYFGTINSMCLSRALLMDIGGCSNQLILVEDKKIVESISLPYGAINLSTRFNLEKALEKDSEDQIRTFLFNEYDKIPWLKKARGFPLIGIGGTLRNIGKISRRINNYPMDISHNYQMDVKDIYDIYNQVKARDIKQREKIKGLSKERADIFLGALAAVLTVTDYCQVPMIHLSGNGLREGLIYEYILRGKEPASDVLDFSLNNIINDYQLDRQHAERVYGFTKTLFNQLMPVHSIDKDMNSTLKTAALLHDLGVVISYYGHHRHSFYMIMNARINGLSHKEQLMAAHIAAFHRKDEFKINTYQYRNVLEDEDIQIIQKLGILLKIAEYLDQRQNGNIEQIQCNLQKDTVIIKLFSKEDPDIEINETLKASDSFSKIFNRKLIIV